MELKVKKPEVAAIAFIVLSACSLLGPDNPPQLLRFKIVEGRAGCSKCQLIGPEVVVGPDDVVTLRLKTDYTFRGVVRTSGDKHKCVTNPFNPQWAPIERNFDCFPEESRELTIDAIVRVDTAPAVSQSRVFIGFHEIQDSYTGEVLSNVSLRTLIIRFEE